MRVEKYSASRRRGRPTRAGRVFCVLGAALLFALLPLASSAIITTNAGAPAVRNTTTGGLSTDELSAYNLQGKFRGFLGTPIAANFFITAQHIGISLSDTIIFDQGPNAGSYTILGWSDDASSDLRIVEIDGSFTAFAQLWGTPDEAGNDATVFGRGGAPNGTVVVASELKGWVAASPDGQISWGRNQIGGTFGLELAYASFDTIGLPNEAALTLGDSGGAWFLSDAMGTIRLAGISFARTGPYQYDAGGSPDGNPFEAALFDYGGLWVGQVGNEVWYAENPVNFPSFGLATRISARIAWIDSVISLGSGDIDNDGILDSFDNCMHTANPTQSDTGGVGTATPDGIGNACQCGDATGDGQVTSFDAEWVKRQAIGLAAPFFQQPGNCDVVGDGTCDGMDALLIRHAAAGSVSPLFGQNCENALP